MYLKGVGPARAKLLKSQLGIESVYDLLHHYPAHYIDRSRSYAIAEFTGEMPFVQVRGRFVSFNVVGEGRKRRLVGLFTDGRNSMEVLWFNSVDKLRQLYHPDVEYIIFGKPTEYNGRWSIVHPEVDTPESLTAAGALRGVYPLTDQLRQRGFTQRVMHTLCMNALASAPHIAETLPADIVVRCNLMPLQQAVTAVHNPPDSRTLEAARFRLKFEELFYLQLNILRYARRRKDDTQGFMMGRVGSYFNGFYSQCLPFPLTGAQKRVVKEIRAHITSGKQMNLLVQGDVGSGKTVVALMAMLLALDNGFQAALMAPTEILATQHYESLQRMVAPIGINVKLLTGSTPKKQRDVIHEQLRDGSLHILIGTHAIIEESVQWRNLGLAVIDEQHRFGVAQRAQLWKKNVIPPHVLVMTATPIPRTLAMTVYGDLDVSIIDELPPGRKPITTALRYDNKRFDVYRFIGSELAKGRQAYIVYPLIEENEKLDLLSLQEGYDTICNTFPSYQVAWVHGRQKPAEKDYQMQRFVTGEARILVATTVIEVGVNVPNASVMLIENAERFGLSQLHQLRGRVGRGADQSYCILMTKYKIAKDTRERLELMTRTTDGFVIAEADLRQRGPGDLEGTMQSGLGINLNIANLTRDADVMSLARSVASEVLDADPTLSQPGHALLLLELNTLYRRTADWGRIS